MNDNNSVSPKPKPKIRFSIDESSPLEDISPATQSSAIEVNPLRKDKRGVRSFGYLRTKFDRGVNKTTG